MKTDTAYNFDHLSLISSQNDDDDDNNNNVRHAVSVFWDFQIFRLWNYFICAKVKNRKYNRSDIENLSTARSSSGYVAISSLKPTNRLRTQHYTLHHINVFTYQRSILLANDIYYKDERGLPRDLQSP
jgi:hypothetical protein